MATAVETYTWAAYEAGLKAYLGVVGTAEDANLQLWLESAAEDCDNYTENDFTDDAGGDITHPKNILLGIYEWVKHFRSWYDPNRNSGAVEIQTGPLREKYQGGNMGTDGSILARAAAYPHWYPSKVHIDLEGVGYR
jgi:hypothetical protein